MRRTSSSQLGATGAPRGPTAAPRGSATQQLSTQAPGVRSFTPPTPDTGLIALAAVRALVIPAAVPDLTAEVTTLTDEYAVLQSQLRLLLLYLLLEGFEEMPPVLQNEAEQADLEGDIPEVEI